ncbi:HAD family hydrolase [Halocalculus aciditolerans]|uniref:Hydrolase n=1 Tax=Halocalculus aciditolerans TaxID=1383812 RepID=A0A830F219_9EURY|nr:HAD family hydrolase [Halocalculus aciditolerans]GGL54475.1 hydrolase [Halocalculus aciditolerans]
MTGYDAVLFDNDGVLVTPPRYESQSGATRAAFEAVGVEDARDEHVDAVVDGVSSAELRELCAGYDLDPAVFWAARERRDQQSQFADFEAGERDAYADLAAVRSLSVPTGVVSNNHHSTVEYVLDRFGLHDTVDTYYGREKTVDALDRKKPNTHYLDRALADLDPSSALYVGDRESDVRAAHAAGLDSAFVRRDHNADVVLGVDPTHELDTLHDLRRLIE